MDTIIGRTYVGDWFLFYLLGQNIDSGAYKVTHSHTFNSQTNGIGPFWQKYKNQLVKSRLTFLGYPARAGQETGLQISRCGIKLIRRVREKLLHSEEGDPLEKLYNSTDKKTYLPQ